MKQAGTGALIGECRRLGPRPACTCRPASYKTTTSGRAAVISGSGDLFRAAIGSQKMVVWWWGEGERGRGREGAGNRGGSGSDTKREYRETRRGERKRESGKHMEGKGDF